MNERIVLVDMADRAVGEAGKLEAHRQNLLHRAISVLVFDDEGAMLVQRRAAGKYHSAGLWSNACCSHPRPGESAAQAAARRLGEEMGLACTLRAAGTVHYQCDFPGGLHENEMVHVFVGRHEAGQTIRPDPAEVAGFDWIRPDALRRDMAARPERYTYWFRLYSDRPWFEMAPF